MIVDISKQSFPLSHKKKDKMEPGLSFFYILKKKSYVSLSGTYSTLSGKEFM